MKPAQLRTRASIVAVASALTLAGSAVHAEIVRYSSADAAIREDQPESARGTVAPTELDIRVTGSQNRAVLMRFDLTGLTSADLQSFADLRIVHRGNGLGNGQAGGVKIYGLNPANTLAGSWNEALVHYRDAGTHGDPTPSPTAQPLNSPLPAAPATAIIVNSPADYGAKPTGSGANQNPNGAPGLRFETAPYSPNVNTLNVNAQTANNAVFAAGTGGYSPYTNQPGYAQTTASGAFGDLVTAGFDRPLTTFAADVDDYTFLGNLNYDSKTRAAGSILAFTTGVDNSPINFDTNAQEANRAALVGFLTSILDGGYTSATFLIMQKAAVNGDTAPISGSNLIFASKEFQPAGGQIGDWAPRLIVAPEPGTMFLGVAGAMMLLRRKRA